MATAHGLKVVEDCAQCHGAMFKGKKAGSMSDLADYLFYPLKVLGGYGDGGRAMTDDETLHKKN